MILFDLTAAPDTDDHPAADRWHWVRTSDDVGWFPALRSGDTWTNQDTWEDFHDEVVEWIEIPEPCGCAADRAVGERVDN